MPDHVVEFKLEDFHELDRFALTAVQEYNLGPGGGWFNFFRGGLYGFFSRIYGVERHYIEMHAWLPRIRPRHEHEYHLATILFQMDSAIENFVFALNALGNAIALRDFRDITDPRELQRVGPPDVVGGTPQQPEPRAGFTTYFPDVVELFSRNTELLELIWENHNLSKHRHTIGIGGWMRRDPPKGFYEEVGVPVDSPLSALYWPVDSTDLYRGAKLVHSRLARTGQEGKVTLEDVTRDFLAFVHELGSQSIRDARSTIRLAEPQLRK